MQYRFAVIYGTLSTIRIVLMTVHSPYQVLTRNRIQLLIKNPGYKTDRLEKKEPRDGSDPRLQNPNRIQIRHSRKTGSDPREKPNLDPTLKKQPGQSNWDIIIWSIIIEEVFVSRDTLYLNFQIGSDPVKYSSLFEKRTRIRAFPDWDREPLSPKVHTFYV